MRQQLAKAATKQKGIFLTLDGHFGAISFYDLKKAGI
jgi:hypothetical protein